MSLPRLGKTLSLRISLLSLLSALAAAPAGAGALYYEFCGGLSQFRGNDPFYGSGAASTSSLGLAFNFGGAYAMGDSSSPVDFHFGLQTRLSTASIGDTNVTFLAPYPMVRLQVMMLYVSAGITPIAWSRTGASSGLDGLIRAPMTFAGMAEGGFLWPVTPKFTLGVAATSQFVSNAGTLSPKPIIDITMVMRFYFAFFGPGPGAGGRENSREFEGWRYPFGNFRDK